MKPTPEKRARWVQCWISLGVALIIFAICAVVLSIDVRNNYHQGAKALAELGMLFAVAAVAYAAFPAAAKLRGCWCWITGGSTIAAGVITLGAAYLAYTSALNGKIDGVVEQQQRVATARAKRDRAERDLAAAERDAAAVVERRSSATLRALHDDALRRKNEESTEARGGCKPFVIIKGVREESRCFKAERDAAEYLRLMGDAEVRERAEARAKVAREALAAVEAEADVATPAQDLAAVDLALSINTTPEDAGRLIARASAVLALVLTAFLGLAMHTATGFAMTGLGIVPLAARQQPAPQPQPTGLVVVAPPLAKPALPKPAPKTKGRPKKTPRQRIEQFAAERLRPAPTVKEQATGAQMHEAFEEWWHVNAPGLRMPDQKLVADVLKKQGIDKAKRGGKVRWSARIEKIEA